MKFLTNTRKQRKTSRLMIAAALVVLIPVSHAQDQGHHEDDEHEEGVIDISPEVLREFGIELARVESGTLRDEIVLPGEIQFNRNRLAYVTPRYAGTVREIRAFLGDAVSAGDVLAVLESNETLQSFEVRAPLDGAVVAFDLTLGQSVESGRPLFTVADLSTLWADLRVYPRDLGKVRKGLKAVIRAGHELSYRGQIEYVAPAVDEHTRTGLARVVIENENDRWKPGMFVSGLVSIGEYEVDVAVPRSAVLTLEGATVVFVQTEEGFEPHPVVLGRADATCYEVIGGLETGETIAVQNVISLKAELDKASFGGHEGHAH